MGTSAPSGPEQRQRSRQANSRGRFQDRVHRGTRGVSHPVVAHRIDEKRPSETTRQKSPSILSDSQSESDDDSGSNGQPEALSSKLVPVEGISVTEDDSYALRATSTARPAAKKPHPQPKLPPKNPFASRPTLLRNVGILILSFDVLLIDVLLVTSPRHSGHGFEFVASHSVFGRQ